MPTSGFAVHVREPELIRPAARTPREFKYLSNIDDQFGLRNHIPFVHFYSGSDQPRRDPVPIIRGALSRALVHYYPLAGRLRSGDKGKLILECSDEGVVFREADADVTAGQLREANGKLRPPFRQWDRFLVDDVWGSSLITDCPLLRLQVTRLTCGGFVLAYTFNHCVCDAYGALQFVTAVSEFARDPSRLAPSLAPAWARETLTPRSPPRISYPHPEYDETTGGGDGAASNLAAERDFRRLAQLSVFLSRADIAALKRLIDGGGGRSKCPTFDAVASCLWRARARALALEGEARLLFPVDTRSRNRPALPAGYYGAAVVFPCAVAPAEDLRHRPLRFAAGMISALKRTAADDEYRASALDFIEANGRRGFCGGEEVFVVSDMSRLGFAGVDFGWGPAAYGGPARAGTGAVPGMVTSVVGHRGEDGVEGLLALVSLPREAVEAFEREVREEVKRGEGMAATTHVQVPSAL